jgi:hypothetical protein
MVAKQTVVNKDARLAVADRFMHEHSGNRRIDAAR